MKNTTNIVSLNDLVVNKVITYYGCVYLVFCLFLYMFSCYIHMTLMTIIYEYEGHSSVPHKKKKTWMEGGKEGNVLFNDALNTFYLRLYGVRHMVKDLSDSEKGNPLPPHRLLFPINSKGSFICTIPQTG